MQSQVPLRQVCTPIGITCPVSLWRLIILDSIIASCPVVTPKLIKPQKPLPKPLIDQDFDALAVHRQERTEGLQEVNEFWKKDRVFISCTKEFMAPYSWESLYTQNLRPVETCEEDLSGPLELKACVNHRACYFYHWNTTGKIDHHVADRPYNWEYTLQRTAWFTIQDVITSAVSLYDFKNAPQGSKEWKQLYEASLQKWNPSSPGVFEIPVCISEFNWNGPIEPVGSFSNFHQRQTIPCSCGDFGKDTTAFWKQANFWDMDHYRTNICAKKIEEKITHNIDRFVAWCRLQIHKGFRSWKTGAATECGRVLDYVDTTQRKKAKELNEIQEAWIIKEARI